MAFQASEQLPVSPSAAAHTGPADNSTFAQLDGSNYDPGALSSLVHVGCANMLLPDRPVTLVYLKLL